MKDIITDIKNRFKQGGVEQSNSPKLLYTHNGKTVEVKIYCPSPAKIEDITKYPNHFTTVVLPDGDRKTVKNDEIMMSNKEKINTPSILGTQIEDFLRENVMVVLDGNNMSQLSKLTQEIFGKIDEDKTKNITQGNTYITIKYNSTSKFVILEWYKDSLSPNGRDINSGQPSTKIIKLDM